MIESQSRTNATIKLSEDYPSGLTPQIPSCTNIQGQINVTNFLGEDAADVPLLSVCRGTCPMDGVMETNVRSTYRTICAVSIQDNSTATLACPSNGIVEDITFANYGLMTNGTFGRNLTSSGCRASQAMAVVRREYLGLEKCTIKVDPAMFGGNPCPNTPVDYLTLQASCRIDTTSYENANVKLLMQVGYPNRLSPFVKTFVTRMNVLGYIDDIVIVCCFSHCSTSKGFLYNSS